MADNVSVCTMTESQIRITNVVFTGFSFISLIIGLTSLLLNRYYYCRYKGKYKSEPIEGIFFLVLIGCCIIELTESFQWFLLLKYDTPCMALGAVREYVLICLLVILACMGTHLLILTTQPKCLQVINEEKQRRYRMLQRLYFTASFLLPILVVPWPFISLRYGEGGYICWLVNPSPCSNSSVAVSDVLFSLFMWYLWAVLAWLFALAVVLIAIYKYCLHRRNTMSKLNFDASIKTIIAFLILFISDVVINALLFVWGSTSRESSFPIAIQVAILTPLLLAVYSFILLVRQVSIIRAGHKETAVAGNKFSAAATHTTTTEAATLISQTHFRIPEDEWYP